MVEAEHSQTEQMRGASPPDDYWRPYAEQFRANPRRTGDLLLDRLLQEVAPHHTVLDVGAGGGRMALPIALQCKHLVAVEPSPSLASVLLQQAKDYRIDNVSVVPASWEEARVDPANIVLCTHVLYTIRDIGPFVRKLDSHAQNWVLIVLYTASPQSQIDPLWRKIHSEERLPLPSLPQFEEVLGELNIAAKVDMLPPQPPRGFDSIEQAMEQLSRRLFLRPETEKLKVLEEILPELMQKAEDGVYRIKGALPQQTALVWWNPQIRT